MYDRVKRRVWDILEVRTGDKTSRFVTIFIIALIILNVTGAILASVQVLFDQYFIVFKYLEIISLILFSIEYALRVWSCTADKRYSGAARGRLRFALTPMALVDMFAVLPFYLLLFGRLDLRTIRTLRMLRFLRLLKGARYSKAVDRFSRAIEARKEELGISLVIVSILLVLASSAMYYLEQPVQPDKFSSIPQALWWGICTITTIGYGDIYPITPAGKVLGGIVALLGIAMFALPAGILSSAFIAETKRESAKKAVCPHCGKTLDKDNPHELL